MIALVGAMFVAFAPARAADPEVGDVHIGRPGTPATASNEGAVTGFCVDPDLTLDGTTGEVTEGPIPAVVRTTVGGTGDATLITVLGPDNAADSDLTSATKDDDADENDDYVEVYCSSSDHQKRVGVTPNGTTTPNIDVKSPAAFMILDRSTVDGTTGGEVEVRLLLVNWATADSIVDATPGEVRTTAATLTGTSVEVDWLRVSGALDGTENPNAAGTGNLGVTWLSDASGFADFKLDQKIIVPGGTSDGEYTVTARVIFDRAGEDDENPDLGTAGDADEQIIATATFSVGDTGDAVAAADLTLGNEQEDNPNTTAIELKAEDGSDAARGGEIWLKLVSKNSLGAPSVGGDVTSVTVIAPGGKVSIYKPGTYASGKVVLSDGSMRTDATLATTASRTNNSAQANDPDSNTFLIKVEKADSKPGSVDVEALVIGEGSKAESETLTLTFGGPGKNLVLGDVKAVAPGKMTEFTVEATDDGGSDVTIRKAGLSFSVKDEDGKPVPATKLKVTQSTVGKSTASTADDDANSVAALVTAGTTAEAGVYTVDVTLVGVSGSTTAATVVVGGSPDSVALVADPDTGDANDQALIKVTATIEDANGAAVVDGTRVEFSVLGTNLAPIGPGHAPIETQVEKQLVATGGTDDQGNTEYEERTLSSTVGGATTKDGEVSVTYVVTGGGSTIVNATTEGGSASGNLRISTTDTSAGEAMPEEEASVSCLSELSGFATWSCGVEADASEIFDMVSGRGVTALHLWNGSTWVRYSVVDGAMVPGSSDFMVTKSDILYISN